MQKRVCLPCPAVRQSKKETCTRTSTVSQSSKSSLLLSSSPLSLSISFPSSQIPFLMYTLSSLPYLFFFLPFSALYYVFSLFHLISFIGFCYSSCGLS
ncbi:hypothetical protein RIF29_29795 [Crotalaria pallida]|uniref:Uncharacterized protein n=1 Tax=Crotalaria pallida TaxID=3830 RepID=A0AAN9EM04_CROPI